MEAALNYFHKSNILSNNPTPEWKQSVNYKAYLSDHEDINNQIIDGARFSKEIGNNGHGWSDQVSITIHHQETDHNVRYPKNQEGGNHKKAHFGHFLFIF